MSRRKRRQQSVLLSSDSESEEDVEKIAIERRSSRLVSKRNRPSFKLPSRDSVWGSIPSVKGLERLSKISPRKSVSNFTKVYNSYNFDDWEDSSGDEEDAQSDSDSGDQTKARGRIKNFHRRIRIESSSSEEDVPRHDSVVNKNLYIGDMAAFTNLENSGTNTSSEKKNPALLSQREAIPEVAGLRSQTRSKAAITPCSSSQMQNGLAKSNKILLVVLKRCSEEELSLAQVACDSSEKEIDKNQNSDSDKSSEEEIISPTRKMKIKAFQNRSRILDSEDDDDIEQSGGEEGRHKSEGKKETANYLHKEREIKEGSKEIEEKGEFGEAEENQIDKNKETKLNKILLVVLKRCSEEELSLAQVPCDSSEKKIDKNQNLDSEKSSEDEIITPARKMKIKAFQNCSRILDSEDDDNDDDIEKGDKEEGRHESEGRKEIAGELKKEIESKEWSKETKDKDGFGEAEENPIDKYKEKDIIDCKGARDKAEIAQSDEVVCGDSTGCSRDGDSADSKSETEESDGSLSGRARRLKSKQLDLFSEFKNAIAKRKAKAKINALNSPKEKQVDKGIESG